MNGITGFRSVNNTATVNFLPSEYSELQRSAVATL